MSSVLNKNHPFRQTITHDAVPAATAAAPAPQAAPPEPIPPVEKKLSKFKKRLKYFAWSLLGAVLIFGYIAVYDALFPPADTADSETRHYRLANQHTDDDPDEYLGPRDVAAARKSSGFLGQFFCRGSRRSVFCD